MSMSQRLQQLVDTFANGRNTRFAKILDTNEARIRGYLSGAVKPKLDFLTDISEKMGVSIDWLITGEGEMLRKDNQRLATNQYDCTPSYEGLPFYDSDFTCNFDEVFSDQNCTPSYYIDSPLNHAADFWCSAHGRSMSPDIEPGDKIALRRCTLDNFEPGHIYAVVMDDLRTVKRLRRVPGDSTQLEFVATNPDYGVERFPVQRIIHLYRVVGKLHSF